MHCHKNAVSDKNSWFLFPVSMLASRRPWRYIHKLNVSYIFPLLQRDIFRTFFFVIAENPSLHKYIVKNCQRTLTAILYITEYSSFPRSQNVFNESSRNFIESFLSAFKSVLLRFSWENMFQRHRMDYKVSPYLLTLVSKLSENFSSGLASELGHTGKCLLLTKQNTMDPLTKNCKHNVTLPRNPWILFILHWIFALLLWIFCSFHLRTLKYLRGKPVWLLIVSVDACAPDVTETHASFHEVQKYELMFSYVTATAFPHEERMKCVHAAVSGTKPKISVKWGRRFYEIHNFVTLCSTFFRTACKVLATVALLWLHLKQWSNLTSGFMSIPFAVKSVSLPPISTPPHQQQRWLALTLLSGFTKILIINTL